LEAFYLLGFQVESEVKSRPTSHSRLRDKARNRDSPDTSLQCSQQLEGSLGFVLHQEEGLKASDIPGVQKRL
jgi:hypothetical protein